MRTIALELLLLLSATGAGAQAQATFKINGGTRVEDPQETHRVVIKAISDIEDAASKAGDSGDSKEAVEEVFLRSQNAISRLGSRGVKAIPEIHGVLSDSGKDWKVKAMMCEALGKTNSSESADELGKVLTDPKQHEFVRAVAGDKLALLGRPESEALIKQIVTDKAVPIKIRERTMMSVGVAGLNDVDWLKQAALGDGFGLPPSNHVEISQDEFGLILNAQRALGNSKNPKAMDAILELQEKYPANGIYTEILERKADTRSIPVLIKVLTYKNPKGPSVNAMTAAKTLGEMKAREAVEPLAGVIENDKNPLVVAAAAKALASIDPDRARPIVKKLLTGLEGDERFSRARHPNFWSQEKAGWGPIAELKALVK